MTCSKELAKAGKKKDPQVLFKIMHRCTGTSGNDPLPSYIKVEYRKLMQSRFELCGSPRPTLNADGEVDWKRDGWFRMLPGDDAARDETAKDNDLFGDDIRFVKVSCPVFKTVAGPWARFVRTLPVHSFDDSGFAFVAKRLVYCAQQSSDICHISHSKFGSCVPI